jgi:hypothetical protein
MYDIYNNTSIFECKNYKNKWQYENYSPSVTKDMQHCTILELRRMTVQELTYKHGLFAWNEILDLK